MGASCRGAHYRVAMRIFVFAVLLAGSAVRAAPDPMAGMDMTPHAAKPAPPVPPPAPPSPATPPMAMPAPEPTPPAPAAMPSMTMDHGTMDMGHGGGMMTMTMAAATGPYGMTREASGTSWQPDASEHMGIHLGSGRWSFMLHGMADLVYDSQSGRRGGDKAYLAGMVMGMATGQLSDRDTLQFRVMLSPDPLMGKAGYPLLLAAGETADGRTQLIDRQHPHDLFMELAATYSRKIGDRASVFVYAGLPGEPAFGPPAFMHRQSIADAPEAPISHHWLDSTHVTFGVVTTGVTVGGVKLEASRFKGREPDQFRYDIEAPKFDSTAVRASWNPGPNWSLQASWTRLKSPEQLTPTEDQERWSASAIYARKVGSAGSFAATAAWGRKTGIDRGVRGAALDAYVLEATLKPDDRWTVFARAERIDSDELLPLPGDVHGPTFTVGKAAVGAIRDFRVAPHLKFGIGAQGARSFTPAGLDPAYGGDRWAGIGFVRVKID